MPRHGESIFKRKDRRWEGRCICGRNGNGKALYKSVYAHSYAECRQKLDEVRNVNSAPENKLTISRLFELWLDSRKNSVKQSTYVNYRALYESYIRGFFGVHLCENITSESLNKHVTFLLDNGGAYGGGLSATSVKAVLMILKSMFKFANSEYGLADPARNVTLPKTQKNGVEIFDDNEIKSLYKLSGNGDPTRLGIALCLNTGMRIGELCALKWSDIDLTENVLHVNKTLQRIKNPNGGTPKTIVVITEPKSKNQRGISLSQAVWLRLSESFGRTAKATS